MYRKAEQILQKWKANKNKKALLVTGARQIGKTYLVRQFGKANYDNLILSRVRPPQISFRAISAPIRLL